MSLCPTQAIRIKGGLATINKNACVDCGKCLKSCPQHAIYVEQDDFNQIFNFKHRIILLPTVLFGQFSEEITEQQIFAELHQMGFTEVIEVAQASGILAKAIQRYMEKNSYERPFISSFCPAIVRLIQVRFPSLIDHIVPLKQAMDLAAIFARKKYLDKGISPDEVGIFYVTPCAAKIAAVKSPVGDDQSNIDGVINLNFIYNKIQLGLTQHRDQPVAVTERTYLSPESIAWDLSEGEASKFEGRCLAIDEIHNVIDILEKIENDELTDIDFLELRACDHSCAGGALVVNNRFLTIERLRKRMQASKHEQQQPDFDDIQEYESYLFKQGKLSGKIPPRSIEQLDENMLVAMEKMEKLNRIMHVLPQIDCGACGAPACHTLARDVVQGKAKLNQCVFMQKLLCNEALMTPEESLELSEKTRKNLGIKKIWRINKIKYIHENHKLQIMTVQDIVSQLNLTVCSGQEGLQREVKGGYTSDLLSDVMGHAQEGDVWVTLQTHKNVMAIASLKEIAAIILVKGHLPEEDTLEESNNENIPILSSPLQTFEITGQLYKLLHP